ncbi:MAG: hypothetical protein HQ591_09475 [candidate division Zixibacteria bacterium]|nr:hypothetical protein [Candidatus Tariuqbacter arcticus]
MNKLIPIILLCIIGVVIVNPAEAQTPLTPGPENEFTIHSYVYYWYPSHTPLQYANADFRLDEGDWSEGYTDTHGTRTVIVYGDLSDCWWTSYVYKPGWIPVIPPSGYVTTLVSTTMTHDHWLNGEGL